MAWYIKTATGCGKSAMKFIARIFHAVFLKGCFQTAFVKGAVVGYKRQPFDPVCYFGPYFRKCRLSVSVPAGESVNLSSPISIIIGSRLNKAIEFVNNLTISHNNYADAAHAGASAIGRFKVYCYKVWVKPKARCMNFEKSVKFVA